MALTTQQRKAERQEVKKLQTNLETTNPDVPPVQQTIQLVDLTDIQLLQVLYNQRDAIENLQKQLSQANEQFRVLDAEGKRRTRPQLADTTT